MIKQTVLPFKVGITKDTITSHAGLALVGEFAIGVRMLEAVDRELPDPGSGAGYRPSEYIFPLGLMLGRWFEKGNWLEYGTPLFHGLLDYGTDVSPCRFFAKRGMPGMGIAEEFLVGYCDKEISCVNKDRGLL